MNIRQLIELLEDAADQVGSDQAEVQLATQAHYPLRYHLAGVYVEEVNDPDPSDESPASPRRFAAGPGDRSVL